MSCTGHLVGMDTFLGTESADLLMFTEDFEDAPSRQLISALRSSVNVTTMLLHGGNYQLVGPDAEFDLIQSRWAGTGALLGAIKSLRQGTKPTAEGHRPEQSPEIARMLGRLSTRERETAHLTSQGMPNNEIAKRLGLAEPTIKLYTGRLLRAFTCRNRVELALLLRASPS